MVVKCELFIRFIIESTEVHSALCDYHEEVVNALSV